ncbi:MAG: hypothetical protein ACOX9E_11715, partial [Lentisphaeria bacterium]
VKMTSKRPRPRFHFQPGGIPPVRFCLIGRPLKKAAKRHLVFRWHVGGHSALKTKGNRKWLLSMGDRLPFDATGHRLIIDWPFPQAAMDSVDGAHAPSTLATRAP